MQNNSKLSPVQQVVMHINTIIMEHEADEETEGELSYQKAFYACKEKFEGMPGLKKEEFKELFNMAAAEFAKPLIRAEFMLAKEEQELRQSLVDCIQLIEADGPDKVRTLAKLVGDLREVNEFKYIQAVKDGIEYADEDLAIRCKACWPVLQDDEA